MSFSLVTGVTVEEREVIHKGKIIKSVCLIAKISMADEDERCGYTGELRVVIGDIKVARNLQLILEEKLK